MRSCASPAHRSCPRSISARPRPASAASCPGEGIGVFNSSIRYSRASYELDFWGKNRAARDAARAAAVASRYDQQTVALTVISSVATTYFQALELRDRLQVAQQNLENGDKILRGLTFEQEVGTATGLDVAQQATVVAQLYAAIPPLEQQFKQTVYALAVLVGRTPESHRRERRHVDRAQGAAGACRACPRSC